MAGVATENQRESIQSKCWDSALQAYGTAELFRGRAHRYQRRIRFLQVLGIGLPVAAGSILLDLGSDLPTIIPFVFWLAAILGAVQLVLSVWALIAKWEDNYAAAQTSQAINNHLADSFEQLAKYPEQDSKLYTARFDWLHVEDQARRSIDYQLGYTKEEQRAAHRAGLYRFQRSCGGCNNVPESLSPTDCDACGNFRKGLIK